MPGLSIYFFLRFSRKSTVHAVKPLYCTVTHVTIQHLCMETKFFPKSENMYSDALNSNKEVFGYYMLCLASDGYIYGVGKEHRIISTR